jgi:zinc transport system substrate-binding protein
MTLKNILYGSIICLTASCSGNNESDKPTLAVSIEPERYILEQLAGDKYNVITVLDNGADPETFEPSMSKRVIVDNSAAYFTIGYLPFENTIVASMQSKDKVVNTSVGMNLVYGTHSHQNDDNGYDTTNNVADPHTWTSIENIRIIATNMVTVLCNLDSERIDLYNERLKKLNFHLDSLEETFTAKLAKAKSHAFAIWHPSLSYFARDYNLEQISVGLENKEISLLTHQNIVKEAVDDSVRVFFIQQEYDKRQAESINKAINSRLVSINPLSYNIETELTKIVDELAK